MTFMAVSNRRLVLQRYILSVNHSWTSQPHHLSAALIFCQDGITFGYKLNDSDECGGLNPLIRMQAGKKYQLRLENQAAQPTNIHTHGLHIPGDGNADDVSQHRQKHTLDIFFDRVLSSNGFSSDHPRCAQRKLSLLQLDHSRGSYGRNILVPCSCSRTH